jgi:circadian clock protein KaiC
MNQKREQDLVEKIVTGIPGFDILSEGGLPVGRVTLVVGTAGAGKTVFASQYLAEGIRRGENGVFVTKIFAPWKPLHSCMGVRRRRIYSPSK